MTNLRQAVSVVLALVLPLTAYCVGAHGEDRLPVPDNAAQERARELIREIFKSDYEKARTPSEKSALARRLLDQADNSQDTPAGQYVLYGVSRRIAIAAGDIEMALSSVERIAGRFRVTSLGLRTDTLDRLETKVRSSDDRRRLYFCVTKAISDAVASDDYECARKLAAIASRTAQKARDVALPRDALERMKAIDEIAEAYAESRKSLPILETAPTDPEANLVVGRYYCFMKGDWERGLPSLALSKDPVISAIAAKDLKRPKEAASQVALADQWWDLAEKKNGTAVANIRGRAGWWYRQALPSLSGLSKSRVEFRLKQVPVIADATAEEPTRTEEPARRDDTIPASEFEVVVWNTHNWKYGERGTLKFNVSVFEGTRETWQRKNVDLEWNKTKPTSTKITVPVRAIDRLRLEITECYRVSAGLAEIQVFRKGENIARGCPVASNVDDNRNAPVSNLTDGITEDVGDGKGYWVSDKKSGWVEIQLGRLTSEGAAPTKRTFAKVTTESGQFFPLKANAAVHASGVRLHWSEIPSGLGGLQFLRTPDELGTTEFKVTESGWVYMAVTTCWGGGGSGGEWQREIVNQKQLEKEGWREIGKLGAINKLDSSKYSWLVFARSCNKGESFSYRTEKYTAPVLILK